MFPVFKCLLLSLTIGLFVMASPFADAADQTLYQRLGGMEKINKIVNHNVDRLFADKIINKNSVVHESLLKSSKSRVKKHVAQLLCAAAQGPCKYTGRTMKNVHRGMNITQREWDHAMRLTKKTLKELKVGKHERQEIMAIVQSTHDDIVAAK